MKKYKKLEEIHATIEGNKPVWALISGAQLRDTPMGAVVANLDAGMFAEASEEDMAAFQTLNKKSGVS